MQHKGNVPPEARGVLRRVMAWCGVYLTLAGYGGYLLGVEGVCCGVVMVGECITLLIGYVRESFPKES